MFPGGIGTGEVLIVLVVAVILFGRNLPQVARSIGQSYQQFRKGLSEMQRTISIDDNSSSSGYRPTTRAPEYQDDFEDESAAPRFLAPPPAENAEDSAIAEDSNPAD